MNNTGQNISALSETPEPSATSLDERVETVPQREQGIEEGRGPEASEGNDPLANSRIARDGLAQGTSAPDFRLPQLDGEELSLEQYRGRKVLLVFSDPECGPCNLLAPHLESLARRTPDIQVVMVSRGDREANRRKVEEHGLTFPVVLQKRWEISRLYAMFATPIAYLIDEQGVIASNVAVGAHPILNLQISAAILSLLDSRRVVGEEEVERPSEEEVLEASL